MPLADNCIGELRQPPPFEEFGPSNEEGLPPYMLTICANWRIHGVKRMSEYDHASNSADLTMLNGGVTDIRKEDTING